MLSAIGGPFPFHDYVADCFFLYANTDKGLFQGRVSRGEGI